MTAEIRVELQIPVSEMRVEPENFYEVLVEEMSLYPDQYQLRLALDGISGLYGSGPKFVEAAEYYIHAYMCATASERSGKMYENQRATYDGFMLGYFAINKALGADNRAAREEMFYSWPYTYDVAQDHEDTEDFGKRIAANYQEEDARLDDHYAGLPEYERTILARASDLYGDEWSDEARQNFRRGLQIAHFGAEIALSPENQYVLYA